MSHYFLGRWKNIQIYSIKVIWKIPIMQCSVLQITLVWGEANSFDLQKHRKQHLDPSTANEHISPTHHVSNILSKQMNS